MNAKLILTDCDGVLLDWEYRFSQFMIKKGFTLSENYVLEYGIENRYNEVKDRLHARQIVTEFNESAWIGWLPPLRDAIKYVRKLNEEHGYIFGVITSLSTNPYAVALRRENLLRIFGKKVFDFIHCIETGADKDAELMEYRNTECWWIEDKIANAEVGLDYKLKPILIKHDYNKHYKDRGQMSLFQATYYSHNIRVADDWKHVYNIITGEK